MNHRFFEERLFADEPLPPGEQILLEEHIHTCERCRALRTAWQETEVELKLAQWVNPREGFSQRWRERYLRQTALAQQRRALGVFLVTSLLAALFAFPFFALIASPAQPLWLRVMVAVYNLSALIPAVEGVVTFLSTVGRAIAQVIPPMLEIAFGMAFLGLMAIWLVMLRKFSFGRVRTQ
jgi:anti-sigma factor RsiW